MGTKTIEGEVTLYYQNENSEHVEFDRVQEAATTSEDVRSRAIETLEDAARYAYGVSETRKEIEKIMAVAEKEIAKWQEKIQQVEAWRDEVLKTLQEKLDYFYMLLSDYHMREYYSAPNDKARAKLKSIKLPYGVTLASREQPPKLEVTDDAALLAYAKEKGQVEVTEKPKWAEIKKQLNITDDGRVVDSDGEVVSFIKVVPQDRKFEVK